MDRGNEVKNGLHEILFNLFATVSTCRLLFASWKCS